MSIARVFIPQIVERYNKIKGRMQTFDFGNAAQYGQLTPILNKEDSPMFLAFLTPKIRAALEDFGESDYFLAVGDPSVIAICAAIILRRQSKIKMLKWDKKMRMYIELEIKP